MSQVKIYLLNLYNNQYSYFILLHIRLFFMCLLNIIDLIFLESTVL